jgi:hypothetical protein
MTNWFGFKPQPLPVAALVLAFAAGSLLGCDDKFSGGGSPDIIATPVERELRQGQHRRQRR